MENFLKSLDFSGNRIGFYTNQNKTHKTLFGGIFSIFNGLILILLIYSFGEDFYLRINPRVVQQNVHPERYMNFTIHNKNFSFAFRIEDLDAKLIEDDQLVYVDFVYYNYEIQDGEWRLLEKRSLNYSRCLPKDFGIEDEYEKQNFQNWFCPEIKNIKVGGNWDESYIKFFRIFVYKCAEGGKNKINQKQCKPQTEFSNLARQRIFFSTFYQKYYINPSNYESPLNTIYSTTFNMIDTTIMKRNLYYFKYGSVITDYGWIFKSFAESAAFNMESIFSDSVSISLLPEGDRNLIFESGIYFAKSLENFMRTYAKIQDLAATVGGIIKIFLILTNFFISFYSENKILYESLKQIYHVPTSDQQKQSRRRLNKNPSDLNLVSTVFFNKKTNNSFHKSEGKFTPLKNFSEFVNLHDHTAVKNQNTKNFQGNNNFNLSRISNYNNSKLYLNANEKDLKSNNLNCIDSLNGRDKGKITNNSRYGLSTNKLFNSDNLKIEDNYKNNDIINSNKTNNKYDLINVNSIKNENTFNRNNVITNKAIPSKLSDSKLMDQYKYNISSKAKLDKNNINENSNNKYFNNRSYKNNIMRDQKPIPNKNFLSDEKEEKDLFSQKTFNLRKTRFNKSNKPSNKKSFKLDFSSFLWNHMLSHFKKNSNFENVIYKLREAFDIKNYLKMVSELRNLKNLLLSDFELAAFDYIKKENVENLFSCGLNRPTYENYQTNSKLFDKSFFLTNYLNEREKKLMHNLEEKFWIEMPN